MSFPSNFRFGVADSDLQTVGEDFTRQFEDSEQTMWDHFAKNSSKCHQNQTPGKGIDRYQHWEQDIEIMKEMGVKHYRTSVSMARILTKKGEINHEAIEWYRKYFKSLKTAGILIYITLYHWELPQYLSTDGGWKNKETGKVFLKHSLAVVENLSDYIEEYFILNEPWASGFLGYFEGVHAPGETNLKDALRAIHNLLYAQGMVFNELTTQYPGIKLSSVFNVASAYHQSQNEQDLKAASYCDGYYNRWFLDPLFKGNYPEDMLDLWKDSLPEFNDDEMKIIQIGHKLHSVGLNFYNGHIVKYSASNPLGFEDIYDLSKTHNDLGWAIFSKPDYPEGLFDILVQLYQRYEMKRIYITENGTALKSVWDGKSTEIDDSKRIEFMQDHLQQVHKAIQTGVPIEAFFAWTFMDNYEWSEGYKPEAAFGLIHIDRNSMKRVYKKSANWYKQFLKRTL